MDENLRDNNMQNGAKKLNSPHNMALRTQFIDVKEVVSCLTRTQREKLVSGRDMQAFARVFNDSELMTTVSAFFGNAMNISETARILYMHRNTLSYRLEKIKKTTGIDIKNFDGAITFLILKCLYEMK